VKKRVPNRLMDEQLNERLGRTGLRLTAQRRQVYSVLLRQRDHPSAEEVFIRAKDQMPDISMATVYNCLDTLVKCGLVKQVHHDRSATRYCSNMAKHHHFYCDACGGTYDITTDPEEGHPAMHLPPGFNMRSFEIAFNGLCPRCASRTTKAPLSVVSRP
jgi:Fur family peroxide stress response transcriptional regulator